MSGKRHNVEPMELLYTFGGGPLSDLRD